MASIARTMAKRNLAESLLSLGQEEEALRLLRRLRGPYVDYTMAILLWCRDEQEESRKEVRFAIRSLQNELDIVSRDKSANEKPAEARLKPEFGSPI